MTITVKYVQGASPFLKHHPVELRVGETGQKLNLTMVEAGQLAKGLTELVGKSMPDLPIYWDDCTMTQLEWLREHGSSQQQKVAQDCIADLKERGKL